MDKDQNHVFPEPDPAQGSTGPVSGHSSQPQYTPNQGTPEDNFVSPDSINAQQSYPNQNQQSSPNSPVATQPQPNGPVYNNPIENTEQYNQGPAADSYQGFDLGLNQEPEVQKTTNKDAKKTTQAVKNIKQKVIDFLSTKWWVVVGIFLLIALLASGIYYFVNRPESFDSSAFTNVTGRIEGPSTSPSGSPDRWRVIIQNRETVAIRDIRVTLDFDRSFQYIRAISPDPVDPSGNVYRFDSLAGIGRGTSDVIIQFEGVLVGNIDENTIMTGTIEYTPEPLINSVDNRRTVSIPETRTRITAPEINVNLTPKSDSVQNGGEAEITATFENLSERDLRDIRISMEYPSGSNFEYIASELQIPNNDVKTTPDDGRNIWFIPVLPRLQTSTLAIRGNLFGADGVNQAFRIEIATENPDGDYEPLATDIAEILVTSQPLIISTSIEGRDNNRTFAPGDTLNFVVNYQNKSNQTIQNLELFGLVDDPANLLDYSTTTFVGGDIGNLNNRVIQWRGSGVPQLITLTPQVSGSVRYSIKVKSGGAFIESGLNQSSYTLRPRAQAKATNIPQFEVGGDLYQAKGELTFNQTIQPQPIDPNQANKQLFRVTWELRTRQSQVNDVVVQTVTPLPPTAWKQASITPSANASELSYDPLTGRIIWSPGSIVGYTGISNPVKSISFDIEVVASSNSSINNTTIFDEISVVGVDDFTGEQYEITNGETKARN